MKTSVRCALGLLLVGATLAGCTIRVKRADGVHTYTWPVPGSVNVLPKAPSPVQTVGLRSNDRVSGPSVYQAPEWSALVPADRKESLVTRVENSGRQPEPEQSHLGQDDRALSVAQLAISGKKTDPLSSLGTIDQDQLDAAIDKIIYEFRRLNPDKAEMLVGFKAAPQQATYVQITRKELVILSDPDFHTKELGIAGIARQGEYYPVIDQREFLYYLSSPFSSGARNAGKWYKIKTASGLEGWIIAEPAGIGSRNFARIVRYVPPRVVPRDDSDGATFLGLASIVCILGYFFFRSTNSGSSSSSSNRSASADRSSGEVGGTVSDDYSEHNDDSDSHDDFESDDNPVADEASDSEDEKSEESEEHADKADSLNEVSFSVRVMDKEDEEPIEGVIVRVNSTYGSWGKGVTYKEKTDDDGWAEISVVAPFRKFMEGGINVQIKVGNLVVEEEVWLEGGETFSYSVDRREVKR